MFLLFSFILLGFRQVLPFLGSPITRLLHIFLFSFCPEPEMHFIKRTLRQFKCKTKLMKAFWWTILSNCGTSCSLEDADSSAVRRLIANERERPSSIVICDSGVMIIQIKIISDISHWLDVVSHAFVHMITWGFKGAFKDPSMNHVLNS